MNKRIVIIVSLCLVLCCVFGCAAKPSQPDTPDPPEEGPDEEVNDPRLIVNGKEITAPKIEFIDKSRVLLPLVAILKECKIEAEWQNETTAEIEIPGRAFYLGPYKQEKNERTYVLDTTAGTLVEKGDTVNILEPVSEAKAKGSAVVYRGVGDEFMIDSDSAGKLFINEMGLWVNIYEDTGMVIITDRSHELPLDTTLPAKRYVSQADNDFRLIVNGKELTTSPHIVCNDRSQMYLPLIAILKECGINVEWQNETMAEIKIPGRTYYWAGYQKVYPDSTYILDTTEGTLVDQENMRDILEVMPGDIMDPSERARWEKRVSDKISRPPEPGSQSEDNSPRVIYWGTGEDFMIDIEWIEYLLEYRMGLWLDIYYDTKMVILSYR